MNLKVAEVSRAKLAAFATPAENGCVEWGGPRDGYGYGRFSVRVDGKVTSWSAHRVAYELSKGAIPPGLFVCHHCDNPKCVNPEHLFAATHTENMRDMIAKGRLDPFRSSPGTAEACRNGHPRAGNSVKSAKGMWCRTCARMYERASYRARKGKPAQAPQEA